MQTIPTLSKISQNPEKLLATGIARTVNALGHNVDLMRERILDLIAGEIVLTAGELTLIQDALTSQKGEAVIDLINYRLFCDFMDERSHQDDELGKTVSSGMEEFQTGGEDRYDKLVALAETMKKHAQHKKDEPGKINAPEIWKYIQMSQKESIQKRNNRRFRESCLAEKSRTLETWPRSETIKSEDGLERDNDYTLEVRYDPDNNLIGGWDSRDRILGGGVISGYRPMDDLKPFFGDYFTIPCLDSQDRLSLIEFSPNTVGFGRNGDPHFNVIESRDIRNRGVIKTVDGTGEILYCEIGDTYKRILYSGNGGSIGGSIPLTFLSSTMEAMSLNGDIIYIIEEDQGSISTTKIYSLQTGAKLSIGQRKIVEKRETESGDIIWTLRESEKIHGTICPPQKEDIEWKLPGFFGTKTISLFALQEAWKKAVLRAKPRK